MELIEAEGACIKTCIVPSCKSLKLQPDKLNVTFLIFLKAGGSESMNSLGGEAGGCPVFAPPPRKRPLNIFFL